ncbi:helix-hairpin-helix domain-containing protein [Streptomyces rectiverticillatus]|uniref:helix-hairpin-helix domain-containing protein n=1 Tax=Streptomyces rectiverticillatus TaxID=173860 RepID=UPI0015C33E76|nr:helix-hairpin-helix domain-containing protein [Streptomyces rectiverticillatus]
MSTDRRAGDPADPADAVSGDTTADGAARVTEPVSPSTSEPTPSHGSTEPPGEPQGSPADGDTQAEHPGTASGAEPDAPASGGTPTPDNEPGTTPGGSAEHPGEPRAAQREPGSPVAPAEPAGAPGAPKSAVAEALAAAVRAVESGERSAASFFTEAPRPARKAAPARPPRPATPAAAPAAAPRIGAEGLAGVREVLAAGGAPESLAVPVAEALGEQAAEALREDPWQLLAVPGVRPEQADGFARALLGPEAGPGDERRARALTGRVLERAALEGHTVLEAPALRAALARHAVPDPDEALQSAIAEGTVLVFQEAVEPAQGAPAPQGEDEEVPVRLLLGLDRCAMAEESLADGLARLISTFTAGPEEWEPAAAAAPSSSAAELIRAAASAGLVTHSGGEAARAEPAALVAAARSLGLRAYAAVHTEDGRRRLAATGDPEAVTVVTVAGLLSGAEGPGRDEDGALALDLLAVLDAPQLDVETAAMLVESLADGTRLALSGDPAVLWSAGPGRVFADVVAARVCPAVVSRTPDEGPVGELVSGIGIGELSQPAAPGKEVVIVPVRDPGEAVHRTVQLVADSIPRAIGVPAEHTQVITPGHGGPAGTRALNAALKERLNPGPGRFGGFDPGDRVAYVPAPGRMLPGTVTGAEPEGLRLDCGGSPVLVPRERVAEAVRHGWAVTAHQAAGTRWPAAVVVLPGDAASTLTRSWIYTAFGRAERHLSVVHGVDQALPRAVAEVPAKERTTRLRALLQAQGRPSE